MGAVPVVGFLNGVARKLAAVAVGTVLAGGAGVIALSSPASADSSPADGVPATVTADVLPTVQINGVVWSQVTVGNTVYATGSFTSARPAGSAPGQNEVARSYLLAYDITTGKLITSFNHSLNAQGVSIAASPDGSRVYVGGDFTRVDNKPHYRIAAFDTATGALVDGFAPVADARVRTIAATNNTVYMGGTFSTMSHQSRRKLAAVAASNGALTSWAPTANASVYSMVLTPNNTKVIVGGQFSSLNGTTARGLGALDAATGVTKPWAANQKVQDYGSNSAITFLRTDGKRIYGGGYVYGSPGNLEGVFAADPETGNIVWVEDCHGDSYDVLPIGDVVYNVSHEHYCGNIGSWPQTTPWTYHRATAFTAYPTGTITRNTEGAYYNWAGNPRPDQLDWYPDLAPGTYTGQKQAAWSLTGNSDYIALGGEFPTVDGRAQQGLVRFAVSSKAPNKVGPKWSRTLIPEVVSTGRGSVKISWTGTWDKDNENLTYRVSRTGGVTLCTQTVASTFWQIPKLSCSASGLTSGTRYNFRVWVTDPHGNLVTDSTAFTVL